MGQVLGRDSSIIPYDVNGWRRLSFTYLNAITENGEIVLDENGVPVDPRTLSRSRSLPGTPNSLRRAFGGGGGGGGSRAPSRQSSFSSAKQYDTNEGSSSARASFRGGFHPERPVLQEYQPKGKTSAADWSRDGSGGAGGGGGQSQRSSTRTASSNHPQHQHEQSVNNRGGGGGRGGDDDDDGTADTTKYADIAFAQGKYSGAGARQGPPSGAHSSHQLPPRLIIGAADQRKVRIEEDGRHRGGAGAGGEGLYISAYDSSDGRHLYSNEVGGNHRAQSPKSSTTWNSSSEDQSFYSDQQQQHQHQHHQLKQIDPPSQYNHQNGASKSSHLFPPSNGVGGGFGSRQSSGRVTTGSSSGGKSTTYLPYNDYYLDRRLRGQHHHHLYNGNSSSGGGPPTYSDFSGYSTSYRHHRRNFRRRRTGVEHRPTGVAKWLFVVGALANVAATIWGSGVYLHLASKSLEIGETIQGKKGGSVNQFYSNSTFLSFSRQERAHVGGRPSRLGGRHSGRPGGGQPGDAGGHLRGLRRAVLPHLVVHPPHGGLRAAGGGLRPGPGQLHRLDTAAGLRPAGHCPLPPRRSQHRQSDKVTAHSKWQ